MMKEGERVIVDNKYLVACKDVRQRPKRDEKAADK